MLIMDTAMRLCPPQAMRVPAGSFTLLPTLIWLQLKENHTEEWCKLGLNTQKMCKTNIGILHLLKRRKSAKQTSAYTIWLLYCYSSQGVYSYKRSLKKFPSKFDSSGCGHFYLLFAVQLCCLMSMDVIWHIRDKLRPMCKHGSILLYVHRNHKAR